MSMNRTARLGAVLGVVLTSGPLAAAGDPAAGAVKAEACLGCHGEPSVVNVYPTYHVPRIAGQHADYLAAAMKGYKDGQRSHSTMQAQAATLSDQDIADIAAYFAAGGKQ